MSNADNIIAEEFIDQIEARESRLLAWGVYDGTFDQGELLDLAEKHIDTVFDRGLDTSFFEAEILIQYLVDQCLLFELPDTRRYRSRMAEALRLFVKLRQLFPYHLIDGAWRQASPLVADLKFIQRPRKYPKRHLQAQDLLPGLNDISSLQMEVAKALLNVGKPNELRLADFQYRSTLRLLETEPTRRGIGTIICAGTGSGKTLAFYLPAYMAIAERLTNTNWTQAIAVYPRTELLKDQLTEALRNARKTKDCLKGKVGRGILLGVLYGDVPVDSMALSRFGHNNWSSQGKDLRCPYLRCPEPGCGGDLVWRRQDLVAGKERLECTKVDCGGIVEEDELILTRSRTMRQNPDLLFTTTELINQRLSDTDINSVFGVGRSRDLRPHLVLLDEVHTYESIHGAQVAHLLRRWRHATGARPHFVGLSATLTGATDFFATLTGMYASEVLEVSPSEEEMVYEGKEYMVALRGDPTYSVALLSTTIQASMLLRRILPSNPNDHWFGKKVFVFTDDLDVTNRLFFDLLDAEGWDERGRPKRGGNTGSLANLRSTQREEHALRFIYGQSWDLSDEIGHELRGTPVRVSRTSSQDHGVDTGAEILVATSSLEVGFDDPEVGAVLQHKAPRAVSAFLQRKGRAGRRRGNRPWTVVVLSDYGRDRLAYRAYEHLFSPVLPKSTLPVSNRYVLKMQATYALLDWLSKALRDEGINGHVWRSLARPISEVGERSKQQEQTIRDRIVYLTDRLLIDGGQREELAKYINEALSLQNIAEAQFLLYQSPRAVITNVVPTIRRRLERDWQAIGKMGREEWRINHPLPEFICQALFGELELPEVQIRFPDEDRLDPQNMGIRQALNEFAPGRVSLRYAVQSRLGRNWIEPNADRNPLLAIDRFCPISSCLDLGHVAYCADGDVVQIPLVRPMALVVSSPPTNVLSSSNSRLNWKTQILVHNAGEPAELPQKNRWRNIFKSIQIHAQGLGNPLEVKRFATGASYEIRQKQGDPQTGSIVFVFNQNEDSEPVALGFTAENDGIVIDLNFEQALVSRLTEAPLNLKRALGPNRFEYQVIHSQELEGIANIFLCRWLVQVWCCALFDVAIRNGISLEEANKRLSENFNNVEEILGIILTQNPGEADNAIEKGKLQKTLENLLQNPIVLENLATHASSLWEIPDENWEFWLRGRTKATIAAAFVEASQQLCPDIDTDTLIVDLNGGPDKDGKVREGDQVWISESSVGGIGFVAELMVKYNENPRQFFELFDGALQSTDFEIADSELRIVVNWLEPNGDDFDDDVTKTVTRYRQSEVSTQQEKLDATEALCQKLRTKGLSVSHPVSTALFARILRFGSTDKTDRLYAALFRWWDELEETLGVEIEASVFAWLVSRTDTFDSLLNIAGSPPYDHLPEWRFSVVEDVIWNRGRSLREQGFSIRNPFTELPSIDRLLLHWLCPLELSRVIFGSDGWKENVHNALVEEGTVALIAEDRDAVLLSRGLFELIDNEIDAEGLLLNACIRGVEYTGGRIVTHLTIQEFWQ